MKKLSLLGLVFSVGCAVQAGEVADAEQGEDNPAQRQDPQTSRDPEPCTVEGEIEQCTTEDGMSGARQCLFDWETEGLAYSTCGDASACTPGESQSCGFNEPIFAGLTMACRLQPEGNWGYSQEDCSTPLVLSFDDAPVRFTQAAGFFDLAGLGASFASDWVSPDTPWLVRDLNHNGRIDDGSELFGSMTALHNGERAQHGFHALAELDSNGDGRICASDPGYADLLLWRDSNQDRTSSESELTPLAVAGVSSLSLNYSLNPRCSLSGCEGERASFEYTDGTGATQRGTTIDVYLKRR